MRQRSDEVLAGEASEQAERPGLLCYERLSSSAELGGRKVGDGSPERRVGRVESRLPVKGQSR
jgi:hypothetical protein